MRRRHLTRAFVIVALLSSTSARAQSVDSAAKATGPRAPAPIRTSISRIDFGRIAPKADAVLSLQSSSGRQRSVGRKIAGGVIGGVGGFFAGGYLGAAIDGDCGGCDDPGLKGAVIGAPIGAAVGAILGVKFF